MVSRSNPPLPPPPCVCQADMLVSELLGSFGDNELSPECLDGAQKFLKGERLPSSCVCATPSCHPSSSSSLASPCLLCGPCACILSRRRHQHPVQVHLVPGPHYDLQAVERREGVGLNNAAVCMMPLAGCARGVCARSYFVCMRALRAPHALVVLPGSRRSEEFRDALCCTTVQAHANRQGKAVFHIRAPQPGRHH